MALNKQTAKADNAADSKAETGKKKDKKQTAALLAPAKLSGPAKTAANKAANILAAKQRAEAAAKKEVEKGWARAERRMLEAEQRKQAEIEAAFELQERTAKTRKFMEEHYPKFMQGDGRYVTDQELNMIQRELLFLFKEKKKVVDTSLFDWMFLWEDTKFPKKWEDLYKKIRQRKDEVRTAECDKVS